MNLAYGREPNDHDEIREAVQDWEDAVSIVVTACLLAASGPKGFDSDELDVVLTGATPAEAALLALGSLDRLWHRAWPEEDR